MIELILRSLVLSYNIFVWLDQYVFWPDQYVTSVIVVSFVPELSSPAHPKRERQSAEQPRISVSRV